MWESIAQKVEKIRQEPEHIRLRYTLGAVIVCMTFIVGIWFLTLKQSVDGLSPAAKDKKGELEEVISEVRQTAPINNSLRSLEDKGEGIKVETNKASGEEFIEKEIDQKTKNTNTIPTNTSE